MGGIGDETQEHKSTLILFILVRRRHIITLCLRFHSKFICKSKHDLSLRWKVEYRIRIKIKSKWLSNTERTSKGRWEKMD